MAKKAFRDDYIQIEIDILTFSFVIAFFVGLILMGMYFVYLFLFRSLNM